MEKAKKKYTMSEKFVDRLISNEKQNAVSSTKSLILHELNQILEDEKRELFNAVDSRNIDKINMQHCFCVQTSFIIYKLKNLSINL